MSLKMAFPSRLLLKKAFNSILRKHSTVAETAPVTSEESSPIHVLRTTESNPVKHTRDHLARFYTVPAQVKSTLFPSPTLPKTFEKNTVTFNETALLVREPAIELISYLEQTDYSRPPNKYILYGEIGTGKTLTIAHLLHYGFEKKRILIHLNWAPLWFKKNKERNFSQTREGLVDLPLEAATWLLHLKHQNAAILGELDLRLQKDYVWNPREQHPAGSPIIDLISFGIVRVKHACDVVDAVIDELKMASTAGRCNCLVALEGINVFFGTNSTLKDPEHKYVYGDRLSLAQSVINLLKYDWCNAAVILTVDKLAMAENQQESFYPRYLLGEEGFEVVDPFLPIEIKNYTKYEFDAVIEYYKDRMWLRNISKQGQRELELLSNKNPLELMNYVNPL